VSQANFQKIGRSDKLLYGPRKLLLCGFPAQAHLKFKTVLDMVEMGSTPKIWVVREQADDQLADLLTLPDDSGAGYSSDLPRAIIAAGITEKELVSLMAVCKQSGMANALWAALTPASEQWTIRQLLAELTAERQAMQKHK
jgi:hypothetical protein